MLRGEVRGKEGKRKFERTSKKVFVLQHKRRHNVSNDTLCVCASVYGNITGNLHGHASGMSSLQIKICYADQAKQSGCVF